MDRRAILVGSVLIGLALSATAVTLVSWEATLYATEHNVERAAPVTADDLPAECRPVAQSLASRNVSLREYRVGIGPVETVLRHTNHGWESGDVACVPTLTFENNLRVEGQGYNVRGRAGKETLHRQPLFGGVQSLVGAVGLCLVAVGFVREDPGA